MNNPGLPQCFGIIPARFGSTRFPGKPLADICGKPMFWHVFDRARQCPALTQVAIATDDDRIADAANRFDVPVIMTKSDHVSGTDRVREAAVKMGVSKNAVVVNIQGDEPLLDPAMLTELVTPFSDPDVCVTTLARPVSPADAARPDQVKVVLATNNDAIYFSRCPIPYARDDKYTAYLGHVGLYAFKKSALDRFVSLPQGTLEKIEKLEQLRLLENGIPIRVVLSSYESISVDRPEDLERVRSRLAESGNWNKI